MRWQGVVNQDGKTMTGTWTYNIYSGTWAATGNARCTSTGTITGTVYANSAAPGNVLPGAYVNVWSRDLHVDTIIKTNANGQYAFTGLPYGTYVLRAFPPEGSVLIPGTYSVGLSSGGTVGALDTVQTMDMVLIKGTPPPVGAIQPVFHVLGGVIPATNWGLPITLTQQATDNQRASYEIYGDPPAGLLSYGAMTEGPAGIYTAQVAPLWPYHGHYWVKITVVCPDKTTTYGFDGYSDPSGTVTNVRGVPISGATVTLSRADSESGPFTPVPNGSNMMAPSNRNNPDTTNASGQFGWDVIGGYYKVRAEKAGCSSPTNPAQTFVVTGVMQIPPPVSGLQLVLHCGEPFFIGLPLIFKGPSSVPMCTINVENETGGQMCYEIYGTGIGQKCFGVGLYPYGTFAAGTYSSHAAAQCGTLDNTEFFPEGTWNHTFSCTGSPQGASTTNNKDVPDRKLFNTLILKSSGNR